MSDVFPQLILVAGKDPLYESGGHCSLVRATAHAARAIGFPPRVFCISDRTEVVETPFGILHRVGSPWGSLLGPALFRNLRSPYWLFHARKMHRALVEHIARHGGPHILHGFSIWSAVGVRESLADRVVRLPVATVHHAYTSLGHELAAKRAGAPLRDGVGPWLQAVGEYHWMTRACAHLERRPLRECDLLVLNYESVRALVRALGAPAERIRKIRYTTDRAYAGTRPPARTKRGEVARIVAVSRHDPRKGLDVLLRALARLTEHGVRFRARLVGKGALLENHRALARKLGLGESTEVVGWVPDVTAELAAADIFVLPSREEGSGSLSLIEAARQGLALVASGIDGLIEDLAGGSSGVLVPPDDPASLGDAIAGLIADPGRRARLQAAARTLFEERFSPAMVERDLAEVYAELSERVLARAPR
jgi:glycosyltransferase involved in cell wall biosynthesis